MERTLWGNDRTFDALLTDVVKRDHSFTRLESSYLERTGLHFTAEDYVSFGLADEDGRLTNVGRLMSDQPLVFNTRIFCTRWNGLEKGSVFDDALDDKEYKGNLIYLLESGCEFVRSNAKVWFSERDRYRMEESDYAGCAVAEAIVNALILRDYVVLGTEIHVDMFDDRLEIVSPGGMFVGPQIQADDIHSPVSSVEIP